jgi:hypothetical protein
MAKGYTVIPASLHLAGGVGSNCYFTLQLDIKDGKYRYKIFDIYTDGTDITNTYFKSNLTSFYMLYLHDKFKGKLLYSKDHFDKNCNEAFVAIDDKINQLIASLNSALVNSKSDTF